MNPLKNAIRTIASRSGLEIKRRTVHPPANQNRPLGDLVAFLEDIQARGFRPKVIVDIGANEGDWTRVALSVFPAAHLEMFEPAPIFSDKLERLAEDCDATYRGVGVSDSDGILNLDFVTTLDGQGTSGSSFLEAPHASQYTSGKIEVKVRSLDSLVNSREILIPDLVKIDVEGFEMSVLRGAESLFGHTEFFLIELSLYPFWGQPILHEVITWMAARDYVPYDLAGFNRRPADGALGQLDVCFVKSDSHFRRPGGWDD
jgi:FkbM family methyltransferase